VEIGLAHPLQKLLEAGRGREGWLENQLALRKAKIDGRVVPKADLLGKALGDANRQAVAPSLDTGLHCSSRAKYLQ
jgi:hypothetical protein